jgi:sugar phosphate isomerase/epimerase
MFKSLSAGAIGVKGTTEEIANLAAGHGFQAMEFNAAEAADLMDAGKLADLRAIYGDRGLRPGGMDLPVQFRADEDTFQRDLAGLNRLARAADAMGCRRCATWLSPGSDELPFEENFELHRRRLRACADVLSGHGIWLGLEFVGPRTSRAKRKYGFIYDMERTLQLAEAIHTHNVGLLLDAWHWYCSEGTKEEILALRPEQVVHVHVNDAPTGIPVAEQVDDRRALPGETGVIDIASFLRALQEIGYHGPVMAEPFSQRVAELPADKAVTVTSQALDKVFAAAGIAAG